jgi:hypothetical protein
MMDRKHGDSLNLGTCRDASSAAEIVQVKRNIIIIIIIIIMGHDSSVSIATRYGSDGPWIESRWGQDFP